MHAELIDPQAMLRLRVLCKLDHARVARLCGLSEAQVRELEQGGHSQFATRDMKVQAALKVAITLSGAQANGMPIVNVFRSHATTDGLGNPLPSFKVEPPPAVKPKFPDSPEFFKLVLVFVVLVFLLVGVAMPLLYTLPVPTPQLTQ
jgi:transcriptional regulator with XRE-family HTH domain